MKNEKDQPHKHMHRIIEKLILERRSLEDSIQDYQSSLMLNRKVLLILFSDLKATNPLNKDRLKALLEEPLYQQISNVRESQDCLQSEVKVWSMQLLMQQQVIDEELLFDTEILNGNLERIDDMRKLMHDKEYSYSNMVQKLNGYEELPDEEVRVTMGSIEMILQEKLGRQRIARMSREKATLVEKIKQVKEQKDAFKEKYRQMIQLVKEGAHYDKISRIFVQQSQGVKSQNGDSVPPIQRDSPSKAKPQVSDSKIDFKPLHKQLAKVLKQEYCSTLLFQEELLQSSQISKESKEFNHQLRRDQKYLDKQLDFYRKRMSKLQAMFKLYLSGEQPSEQITRMELERVNTSNSDSQEGQLRDKAEAVEMKEGSRMMMVRSGSEPDLKTLAEGM